METYNEEMKELNKSFIRMAESLLDLAIPNEVKIAKLEAELFKLKGNKLALLDTLRVEDLEGALPF